MLQVARRSAIKARTQAKNQLHALTVTAPEQVKHQLVGVSGKARIKICAGFRPGTAQTTTAYAKKALRVLARRHQSLTAEIKGLDTDIKRLCAETNPALLAAAGVGADTAAALLITAGDNPERMRTEASFAALRGVSPVQASSGRIVRHRLNRGGNRQANQALWRIATTRMRWHQPTIEYVEKRRTEGKTRKEIIRCLRHDSQITLAQAATALHSHATRISQLERGLDQNHHLATRHHKWLTTLPHQDRI